MVLFKSLVILDLETSGLPSTGGRTKITELSMLGVLSSHVVESHRKCEAAPRVLQKLNLCFYPQKMIDFEASEITGLDNLLLEEIPVFNREACEMVASFLNRMPSPLCVIAHNGLRFDFQLLKSELAANDKVLPDEIFCADSILAFKSLFPATPSMISPLPTSPGRNSLAGITPISDPVTPQRPGQSISSRTDLDSSKADFQLSVLEQQKMNETTPKQPTRQVCPTLKRRNNPINNENEDGQTKIVRKKLFKGQGKPNSYKLCDLYLHIHGREPQLGHRAEGDTVALLECIVSTAPEFLSWIEGNNLPLHKIPCMW